MYKKLLTFLVFIITQLFTFSQGSTNIYQPQSFIFYWGLNNPVQISSCSNCDSIILDVIGARITKTENFNYEVFVTRGTRKVKLVENCYKNGELLYKDTIDVKCVPFPPPSITLISEKYNNYANRELNENLLKNINSTVIANFSSFNLEANEYVPFNINYKVLNWKITFNGQTFVGQGSKITEELKSHLKNYKPGDELIFEMIEFRIEKLNYHKRLVINAQYLFD